MAGFMIENISQGTLRQFHLEDVPGLLQDDSVTRLDVRTAGEYARGHIEGFSNIPVDELRERLSEIAPERPVYVICQSGLRSYIATRILAGNGFECYNFSGGFRFYETVTNEKEMIEETYPCGMDK